MHPGAPTPNKPCVAEGCTQPVMARGMCGKHYQRWMRHGTVERPKLRSETKCAVEVCDRLADGGYGWCKGHYRRWRAHGDPGAEPIGKPGNQPKPKQPCAAPDCGRFAKSQGMCEMHYARWKRHGTLEKPRRRIEGARKAHNGYVYLWVPDHPYANKGRVAEHRVKMEDKLGRLLEPNETVHHKNGVRDDNRLANLELWADRHPKGQRVQDLRAFAKEILALYPD